MPKSVAARHAPAIASPLFRLLPVAPPGTGSPPRPDAPARRAPPPAGFCPCAAPAAGESLPTSHHAAEAGAATDAGSVRYEDGVHAWLAGWRGRLRYHRDRSATGRGSRRSPTRPEADAPGRAPAGCRFLRNCRVRSRHGQRRGSKAAAGARLRQPDASAVARWPSDPRPGPADRVRSPPAPDGCGYVATTD
ncbi:hypothetical protein D3C72_1441050 [compost metagenome]